MDVAGLFIANFSSAVYHVAVTLQYTRCMADKRDRPIRAWRQQQQHEMQL